MSESYEEKFNELKNSISNFTDIDVDKPLGEKLNKALGDSYNSFLQEEINSISVDIRNIPLKNLVKNNMQLENDNENFNEYYKKYVENTKNEIKFDIDRFEDLLYTYADILIEMSNNLNELEEEIINFFKNIDNIKGWVNNIPSEIDIDTTIIELQIKDLLDNQEIKNKIKNYKDMKIKYFFLKHYFFDNPFIRLAENNEIHCNNNEYTYKHDLESDLHEDIPDSSPSLLKSFLNLFF